MRIGRAGLLWLLSWGGTALVLGLTAGLVAFVAARGGAALGPSLLFGDTPWWAAVTGARPVFDGIWPSLVGTLLLVVGASVMAVPVGVLAGVHLADAAPSRTRDALRWSVDLLAGVPSIIMGLFGFGMILLLRRTIAPGANTSLLLAMVCLAALVLPYLVRATEAALEGLPESLRLAGPALGLSHGQSLWRILLPAARRGVLSGVFLAVGRIAEDTAVILMTGVVANSGLPGRLTGKFQALPFDIYFLASENRGAEDLQRAFGTALVLLMLTSGLFLVARLVGRGLDRREGRES